MPDDLTGAAEVQLPPEPLPRWVVAVTVAVSLVVLAGRFFVRAGLWLDEALSVNIARLPLGEISGALRHDGHPPLFYVLLHGWMRAFGTSDHAVRGLSAVFSFACLPLAFRIGKRLGGPRVAWLSVMVLAVSPYFLRYGSEARMYSLIMLLVFAGYLVIVNALESPRLSLLIGTALITGALLWTHYWAMWVLGAAGIALLIRWFGHRDRASLLVIGSVVVGGLAFLPWVPTMLYQAEHTGTPWAKAFRPATLIVQSWQEFSGGPYSESQVLSLFMVAIVLIGLCGRAIDEWRIELDLRTRVEARLPAILLLSTVVVASIGGIATQTTFAPRYAAIYFPFIIMLTALGISRFRGRIVPSVAIVAFLLLSIVGNLVVLRLHRTEAVLVGDAVHGVADTTALVVTCPDQLGPAVARAIGPGYEIVTYPNFGAPERVDWVDYSQRNAASDPSAFVAELLRRAGNRRIFLAVETTYETLQAKCAALVTLLGVERPSRVLVRSKTPDYFETMSLYVFDPRPETVPSS